MWFSKTICVFFALFSYLTAYSQPAAQKAYIEKYKAIAVREMAHSGVPASITIAQGILESNAGRSDLAIKANNHFGMKISGNWFGKRYAQKDDEYDEQGNLIDSYFRMYESAKESFADHSRFLQKPRYAALFKLKKTDYKGWARGLKAAGYATSKTYARQLIALIERYDLQELDKLKPSDVLLLENTTTVAFTQEENQLDIDAIIEQENEEESEISFSRVNPRKQEEELESIDVKTKNEVKYTMTGDEGYTLKDISKLVGASTSTLLKYNEHILDRQAQLMRGTIVFLQPKKKDYLGKSAFHVVNIGENMLDISNRYAIDLLELRYRNRLAADEEPAAGASIKLKGRVIEFKPPIAEQNPKITGTLLIDSTQEDAPRAKPVKNSSDLEDPFGPGKLNNSKKKDKEQEGQDLSINLPDSGPIPLDKLDFSKTKTRLYKVRKGDTLYRIARKFNTTVDALKKENNLSSDYLNVGMELWIQ